jgi:hypothetical protein
MLLYRAAAVQVVQVVCDGLLMMQEQVVAVAVQVEELHLDNYFFPLLRKQLPLVLEALLVHHQH